MFGKQKWYCWSGKKLDFDDNLINLNKNVPLNKTKLVQKWMK